MQQKNERQDPIAPYLEIADIIQQEIEDGKYKVGEKLSSESQFCRRFRVNRYTLRQSLDLLENTGLIRSHQGKGHFVCEKPLDIQYTITPAMRFSEVMKQIGCKPEAKLINQSRQALPVHVANALGREPDEEAFRLEILRYASGTPLTWNITWLPAAYFPDLMEHTSSFHSLYAVLENVYKIRLHRIWSTFQATYPSAMEARYLQISPNTNLLHIESTTKDEKGRLVEYTSAKYRGDLCKVSIRFES